MKYGFKFYVYACQIRRSAVKTSVWYDPYLKPYNVKNLKNIRFEEEIRFRHFGLRYNSS